MLRFGPTGLYLDISQIKFNDYPVPFLKPAEFRSATGVENINFTLIDSRHNDFSYDPTFNQSATDEELNIATNLFARKLSEAAIADNRWQDFISKSGIYLDSYDENKKVWKYKVDPIEFERNFNQ